MSVSSRTLVSLSGVEYSVGGPPLLEQVDLSVDDSERVCIVGRNGVGKSTLLKILAGTITPDDGRRRVGDGVRMAALDQAIPDDAVGTVFDIVAQGLGEAGAMLAEYHRLVSGLRSGSDTTALSSLQARIDAEDAWRLDQRVEATLSRLELPGSALFETLSGGLRRRVLLARALVREPDLLLLDEPTNHLDIDAIAWLESQLRNFPGSIVFVTHDRSFLRVLATRIVEIDRGRVTSWPGDYANYLRRREERLAAESEENARFDRKLAEEERWIRQGIKARRTRNEGRVRALQAMRRERSRRREHEGTATLSVSAAERSGKLVAEATGVGFAHDGQLVVRDFSTTILRGDRIGIIGPNGSGKTTLLRLLLAELAPDQGRVRLGTRLEIAYFDQHRAVLRDDLTAAENVADGQDFLDIGGQRRHVLSFLQEFLFTPERARAPITALSGGERNRLLLARLFSRPSNLLVMDEPTNDLDVETLELLEERLASYAGTLLLVSHDRWFLDNVVTSTLVLEGGGRVGEYVGGYSDWVRQRPASSAPATASATSDKPAGVAPPRRRSRGKLSYRDALELEALPERIEALEQRMDDVAQRLNDPALYQDAGESERVADLNRALASTESELEQATARWEYLEAERERLDAGD